MYRSSNASASCRSAVSCLRSLITVRSVLVSKPVCLGLAVDFLDVVGERLLLLLEPLDALDDRLQLIARDNSGPGRFAPHRFSSPGPPDRVGGPRLFSSPSRFALASCFASAILSHS